MLSILFILLVLRCLLISEDRAWGWTRFGLLSAGLIATLATWQGFVQHGIFLLIGFILIHLMLLMVERFKGKCSPGARIVSLSISVMWILIVLQSTSHYRPLLDVNNIIWGPICGMLLCLKESNYLIRYCFDRLKLIDKISGDSMQKTENGRIIGNLERLLLYIFLSQGAVIAATFIVAVKGLARFKKMEEDQAFAEYVIIGTFLSVLITLFIFEGIQILAQFPF